MSVSITANQVTLLRIFLLPVPVYLLIYGQTIHWWISAFLFIILGATDFVDGMMARREGPTILGSLLDPVADKIFIASIMLSFVAMGIFPFWVASVVLLRELLMTALRSSMAVRDQSIKTSLLGKLKTIIQMGGTGTIFLTLMLEPWQIFWANLFLALPFLIVAAIRYFKKARVYFWALPVFASFMLVAFLGITTTKNISMLIQVLIIVLITWASAFDYLITSMKLLLKTGFHASDWSRILWAIAFGALVVPIVSYYPITVLPILVSVSLEFGLGGIDNILSSKKILTQSWPFYVSCLYACFFSLAIYLNKLHLIVIDPLYAAILLSMASSITCGILFGKNNEVFIKSKHTT